MSTLSTDVITVPNTDDNVIARVTGRTLSGSGRNPGREPYFPIRIGMAGIAQGSLQSELFYDQTVAPIDQIVDSENVSSVTDSGVGDFEPNFTTSWTATNTRVFHHSAITSGGTTNVFTSGPNEINITNSIHSFNTRTAGGVATDYPINFATGMGLLA